MWECRDKSSLRQKIKIAKNILVISERVDVVVMLFNEFKVLLQLSEARLQCRW